MPSHDDELNRLLDALALGTPPGSLELDRETVETTTRLMGAGQTPGAPSGFAAQLEESLMNRASMRPVAVSGRIEHVGEGIGLVAARPMPRRLRIERIAAIAAVAILLLAASNFFRSDSDDGGHWLMAPVASASPVPAWSCPSRDDFFATLAAIAKSSDYKMDFVTGVFRSDAASPGSRLPVLPASFLPTGPAVSGTALSEVEAQFGKDIVCWVAGFSSYEVMSTIQYDDGRVGLLVKFQFPTGAAYWFYTYAPYADGWGPLESIWVWLDEQIAETSTFPVSTAVDVRFWNVTSDVEQTSNMTPAEMRVPADSEVTLTLNNIGTVIQDVTIPDAGIDVTLNPGESKTITATFTPGGHKLSMAGEGDTAPAEFGFIYAETSAASPTASNVVNAPASATCPTSEDYLATVESNGSGIQVPGVVLPGATPPSGIFAQAAVNWQPAPNDPATLIQVIPSSELPLGNAADATVWADIAVRIPNDLYCLLTGGQAAPGSPITISQMSVLPDGSVGVLLDSDPLGYGVQVYMTYARGTSQWMVSAIEYVMPDALYTAPDTLPIKTRVRLQGWIGNTPDGTATAVWPGTSGIPANTDVVIEAVNLDDDPLTFELPDAGVSIALEPGESAEATVNLSEGVYRYGFTDPANVADTGSGYLFAVDPKDIPATPVASPQP
jgi:uncharacterized cupredoxin-like copper-binding protein